MRNGVLTLLSFVQNYFVVMNIEYDVPYSWGRHMEGSSRN